MSVGKVFIMGAGCGDPGLLTIKAYQILQKADCILYDRLIDDTLLSYTKKSCKKLYVGKENHYHVYSQKEIEQCLITCAHKYTYTVRLKGGDPYVFGRGGEEALALHKANIAFEVIPGISSSIGGLAYAGIPVTHRGMSRGFRVYTAHTLHDEMTPFDFKTLAKSKDTLVFLMGRKSIIAILKNLEKHGMCGDTPAAVCSHLSMPAQTSMYGNIVSLQTINMMDVPSPAILVVGEVVALHTALMQKPCLLGKRYLILSLYDTPEPMTWTFREHGAEVKQVQTGQVERISIDIANLFTKHVSHIIFVSSQAVVHFFSQLFEQGFDVRELHGVWVGAIGDKTAKQLQTYGVKADGIPTVFDAIHFVEQIKQICDHDSEVYICKGQNAHHVLQNALSSVCHVQELCVYATKPLPFEITGKYDGVICTCAFSVHQLLRQHELQPKQKFYAIGRTTAQAIMEYGYANIVILPKADKQAFVPTIIKEEQHV